MGSEMCIRDRIDVSKASNPKYNRLGLEKMAKDTCQLIMNVFNPQSWCPEPYLSTDRRTMYTDRREYKHAPSSISHYLRRCRSSISYYGTPIKAKITGRSYQPEIREMTSQHPPLPCSDIRVYRVQCRLVRFSVKFFMLELVWYHGIYWI